jgi:hypothetical protein
MRKGAWLVVVLFSACGGGGDDGDDDGGGSADGVVTVYNGATPDSSTLTAARVHKAADGEWQVSPDHVSRQLTSLTFIGDGGLQQNVPLTDCFVDFDLAEPGLAQHLDCEFTLAVGTYNSVSLSYAANFEVLIDDDVNGLFTDPTAPTKLAITEPAGGAQPITVDAPAGQGTGGGFFPNPIVVDEGDVVPVSIVLDALQVFQVSVSGGTAELGFEGNGIPGFPDTLVSIGVPAAVGYYVNDAFGTAGSYGPGAPQQQYLAISVLMGTNLKPSFLGMRGDDPLCHTQTKFLFPGAGNGYLGMTDDGIVGWANQDGGGYVSVMSLQTVEPGEPTNLLCQTTTTDPAPPDGKFEAAPPTTDNPTLNVEMTLLAH